MNHTLQINFKFVGWRARNGYVSRDDAKAQRFWGINLKWQPNTHCGVASLCDLIISRNDAKEKRFWEGDLEMATELTLCLGAFVRIIFSRHDATALRLREYFTSLYPSLLCAFE